MQQSIDLTRLPTLTQSSPPSSKHASEKADTKPAIEYSSREVSPSTLLVQQLIQAHHVFTLHHGPSLTELYVKLPRERFCNTLERYWARFSRTWDVLLHGSPASDIFGGIKLSSGGELGMGVGEEEWGSGERDVLEGLTRRTEGLVDLVVSRFGDSAPPHDEAAFSEAEALPWMGGGNHPMASDGVIFGGVNAIARPSLRNVSLWMRQIYTYGDYAYGVRDNPHRERRKRRRRNPPAPEPEPEPEPAIKAEANGTPKAAQSVSVKDHDPGAAHNGNGRSQGTSHLKEPLVGNNAEDTAQEGYNPGIPPPIVSAVQQSLDNATRKAGSSSTQPQRAQAEDSGTTMGIPDQYMKYLTFGLSTLAKPVSQKRPDPVSRTSTSSSKTIKAQQSTVSKLRPTEELPDADDDQLALTQMDPMPDGQNLQDKIAIQKRQEENGHFAVGLKGDLEDIPDDPNAIVEDVDDDLGGPRNILRVLQVEVVKDTSEIEEERTDLDRKLSEAGLSSAKNDPLNYKRLRVLIYVRRPFMYCFLFKTQTPALSLARFYKDLHCNLLPIHNPLLSSTSVARITQRIEESQQQAASSSSDTASVTSGSKSQKASEPKPIYDLIYDPALLTVHTSIPNVAEPGTPDAEGIRSSTKDSRLPISSDWNRIEALNVHSQILNTLASTHRNRNEYERVSKTSRGWWVVWMKLPPSNTRETAANDEAEPQQEVTKGPGKEEGAEAAQGESGFSSPPDTPESEDAEQSTKSSRWLRSTATTRKNVPAMDRIAFLVRKATDPPPLPTSNTSSRAASSMWQTLTLRPNSTADENTGGTSAGWGPAALAGGIGIDARKYVESLLQLNR